VGYAFGESTLVGRRGPACFARVAVERLSPPMEVPLPAKTPEQQAAYDASRKRFRRVLLRLDADEAARLSSAAAASGQSVSAYVMSLVAGRPAPVVDLAQVSQLTALVAVLAALPKSIRDLEADLGRLSGRLSHLFTVNPRLAREHDVLINETFRGVRDLMAKMLPEISRMQLLVAEPRALISEVLKQLMREVSRKPSSSRK
jgi:uncharacterized protein (DUF1778 family)